jgi:hypothetical protein
MELKMPVKYDKTKIIRPDTQIKWTMEMVQEYAACAKSVEYFAFNHCKVSTIDGIIQLQPRSYQKRMLETVQQGRFSVMNCPRQVGKCCVFDTLIEVRNKKTGQTMKISMEEFFDLLEK